jgi:hypothetical protein
MVPQLSCLALEVALNGPDILLIGVVCFPIVVVAAGCDCDPPTAPLLALLATLSASLSALDGGFRRCSPAIIGGRFPIARSKGNPNHLLARGVPGSDVKQVLGGVRLITIELMHQGTTRHAGPEC